MTPRLRVAAAALRTWALVMGAQLIVAVLSLAPEKATARRLVPGVGVNLALIVLVCYLASRVRKGQCLQSALVIVLLYGALALGMLAAAIGGALPYRAPAAFVVAQALVLVSYGFALIAMLRVASTNGASTTALSGPCSSHRGDAA